MFPSGYHGRLASAELLLSWASSGVVFGVLNVDRESFPNEQGLESYPSHLQTRLERHRRANHAFHMKAEYHENLREVILDVVERK